MSKESYIAGFTKVADRKQRLNMSFHNFSCFLIIPFFQMVFYRFHR